MLTVVGFPRSGTNFLHRMLAHYIDGPDAEVWTGTPAHPHVNKIHWQYQDNGSGPLVYIYRDPRDVALSGWEYIRQCFEPDVGLMEFLEHHFSGRWDLWPAGWREHTRHWLARSIPSLSYEIFCNEREDALVWLISRFGLEWDHDSFMHAIEQSYNFGERHDGRWINELPKDAAACLDGYCGDLMQELGYT